VLLTKENASGSSASLWATPNTLDHLPQRSKEATLKMQNGHRKGRTKPSNLREQVDEETMKMWPTPTTKGYGHGSEGQYQNLYKKMVNGIISQADLEVMTKTKMENHRSYKKMTEMWPTPRARDFKDGYVVPPSVQSGSRNHTLGTKVLEEQLNDTEKGSLNPDWVEWLMGYDRGWTDLDCDNPKPHVGFIKEPEDIPRVAKGKKDRAKRLKGLGNAVLPQIPMQIALAIKETRLKETN